MRSRGVSNRLINNASPSPRRRGEGGTRAKRGRVRGGHREITLRKKRGLPRASAGRHDHAATAEDQMSAGTEGFAHPEFLVETAGLAARLGDPELRIFD